MILSSYTIFLQLVLLGTGAADVDYERGGSSYTSDGSGEELGRLYWRDSVDVTRGQIRLTIVC